MSDFKKRIESKSRPTSLEPQWAPSRQYLEAQVLRSMRDKLIESTPDAKAEAAEKINKQIKRLMAADRKIRGEDS